MNKEKVYVVIHHDFDGVWYYDKIISIFKDKEKAEQFKDESPFDLSVEEHEITDDF